MKIYDAVTLTIAKAVGIFAPSAARKYLKEHTLIRAYEAAKYNAADRFFRPTQSTGAQEMKQGWQTVTNKTRDLARNNSHVAGMKRRFVAGVVGEGSWPRPKVVKDPQKRFSYNKKLNQEILNRWEEWALTACANGDSIYQLQRLSADHFFIDGGLLIQKVYVKDGKKRNLALLPIEYDQLDTSKDTDTEELRIVNGKELDKFNKPVAYWIKSRHPAEKVGSDSIRVEAKDIIDLYDRSRATEVSGMSRLAPCVTNFHNIGMYRTDTMKLARTALGYGVFVETEHPEDEFGRTNAEKDSQGNEYEYVTSGAVHYLRPGEKIQQVKPENPGSNYEPFVRSELRGASLGAGMSYESASNDGSQTNFSGGRQMMLFERAMLRYTFAIFEERFYSKVYEWFIEHEHDFKGLNSLMPGYKKKKHQYLRCSWSRPKTEWVDPLKDGKAITLEINTGYNTLTEVCENAGRDIEEVIATRKYERQLQKEAGLLEEDNA